MILLSDFLQISTKDDMSDDVFFEIFKRTQQFVDKEILSCLLLIAKPYSEMFALAKRSELAGAQEVFHKANRLRNKFEFGEMERDLFKVFTYPKISYLKYKLEEFTLAKWYTTRLLNILKLHQGRHLLFDFSIYQQRINYTSICFKSGEWGQGLNISLNNMIEILSGLQQIRERSISANSYSDNDYLQFRDILLNNIKVISKILYAELNKNRHTFLSGKQMDQPLIHQFVNSDFRAAY